MNKLSIEEKVRVVACLVEGNSLRSTGTTRRLFRSTLCFTTSGESIRLYESPRLWLLAFPTMSGGWMKLLDYSDN
jgi:hypothetical protein